MYVVKKYCDKKVMCSKKLIFIKEQEASGLLSSLRIKTILNKILLLGKVLFWRYKMNDITKTFLLSGDNIMPEIDLRLNLRIGLADHSWKTKTEHKNLRKQKIQNAFIKAN